jgi:hypothetical protein
MLFDLAAPVEYFVEANGVNSKHYNLKVIDLPYVQRLELEYHFPAYTGLPPQKVEDGGDIAVLKGTEVRVRALPTMAAPGGQVVIGDSDHAVWRRTPRADPRPRSWGRSRSRKTVCITSSSTARPANG